MTRENFEVGVQRVYYVAWVIWVICLVLALIDDQVTDVGTYIFAGGLGSVVPLALMHAARWTYRGFFPKSKLEAT